MKRLLLLATALVCGALAAHADVSLSSIFGDNMVLQQGVKVPIWGWAEPGEKIQVSLGKTSVQTEADAQGCWRVEFPPRVSTANPTTLVVAGKNTLSFQGILVGEVWLASGQSNMAFPLEWETGAKDWLRAHHEEAIADGTLNNPQIHIFCSWENPTIRPDRYGKGRWDPLISPPLWKDKSAVAYFFAEKLYRTLNCPIGILETCVGGTPIETWSSKEALAGIPGKQAGLDAIAKMEAAFPTDASQAQALMDDFHKRDNEWVQTVEAAYHKAHDQWQKDADAAKLANKPSPPEPPYPQTRPVSPNGQSGMYGTLFNGMIAPYVGFPITGAIWYQGEANGPDQYDTMLSHMVTDWRKRWGYDFTFLPVMLANIGDRYPDPTDNGWAGVREAEEKVSLELPRMGTALATDVGTGHNIHPYDKIDVGQRLAAQALRIAYGQNIVSTGPRFDHMKIEGSKIRVSYQDVGSGLQLAESPFVSNDPVNDNLALPIDKPLSFDIAGADKTWVTAEAKLDGNEVLVWSDKVPSPVAVRYAFTQNPKINLYNKEGFPAVPFRTETWPAPSR